MAEIDVAVEESVDTGLSRTKKGGLSAADVYLIPNDGKTALIINNAGAEDTKVTIKTPGTEGGLAIADQEVTVAKEGGEKVIGPFRKSLYNNKAEKLEVTLSKVAEVTLSAVQVG